MNRRVNSLLVAAVVAAGLHSLVLVPAPARACTFADSTFAEIPFSVSDGDIVPVNVVLLSRFIGPDDGTTYWLLNPDGTPTSLTSEIDLAQQITRLVPDDPLSVDTTYRLVFVQGDEPPVGDAFTLRLTFSTRAAEDTPPSAPIVSSETKEIFPDPLSTCGPVEGETWARFFVQPNDAEEIAMYRLVGSDGIVEDLNLAPFVSRDEDGNIFLSKTESPGGEEAYSIISTSHSGLDSVPTQLVVNLGCPGSCGAGDSAGGTFGFLILIALRKARRHRRIPARATPVV